MANLQSTSQQASLDIMLSPEAKEFVPRCLSSQRLSADTSVSPINGLPSYVTTCYPFVSSLEPRTSGRGHEKHHLQMQPQYFPSPQYSPLHTGMPQNKFPHPVKNFRAWNQTSYGNVYPHPSSITNSMPFDGGPCQNGYVNQPLQHLPVPVGKPLFSSTPSKFSTSMFADTPQLVNGFSDPLKLQNGSNFSKPIDGSHYVGSFAVCNTPVEAIGTGHIMDNVCCVKSSMAQTDFHPNSASVMLDEKPDLVLKTSRSKNKQQPSKHINSQRISGIDAEVDINLDICENKVHKQNTICNKTDPLTNLRNENSFHQDQMAACSYLQSTKSSNEGSLSARLTGMESVNLVPFTNNIAATMNTKSSPQVQTYASIAKSKPSQIKQNLVSTSNKSNTNVSEVRNNGRYFQNNMRIGNDSINVVQIMADLEKADTLSVSNTLECLSKMQNSSKANLSDENLHHAGTYSSGCTTNGPILQRFPVTKHKDPKIVNQDQIHSFSCNEDQQKHNACEDDKEQSKNLGVLSGDNCNEILGEGAEVRRKKRRRRRHKKRTELANQDEDNDDANSGTNDDVTLHFEDEEEFPDLSTRQMSHATSLSSTYTAVSYSEVLKQSNNEVASLKSAEAVPSLQANNIAVIQPSLQLKESRTSRKRRKRREVANKAAEAEMAEISLEQHMLELKMKQKLPQSTKKSVSPVRAASSQGVWKLNPSPTSQPSSSGKKVSLLLPGTVPPEPPVPHQPNSTIKQPGILKMPSPSVAVNKGAGAGRKSKQPISCDLAALIGNALESKKDEVHTKKDMKPVAIKKEDLKPHNSLDASAPLLKRGKERETPKIKKPSPLKKVILKEREEKKRLRLLDDDDGTTGAPVGIGVVSGGESDLSQDTSFRSSMEVGLGTPASAEMSPISQQSPSCMSPMSSGTSPMNSGVNSPVTGTHVIQQTVKLKIHSRRFREYCNQLLDKEVDNHVTALLTDLVRFQDKQYHKDPVKAKAKRRFVLGLREVTKHLKLRKVKCVIISPNLEKIQSKGGLDDALNNILELCNEQKVPFIFSLGRRALGRACAKLVPVSVVGIFNFEGSEENFRSVVALTEKAREQYREMISQIEKEIAEQPPRSTTPGVPHIFAHYGHSRTPSGCSVISFTSSILSEPISENYPQSEPETDNRGYEIEDKVDTEISNDNKCLGKQYELEADPYEADDESGFDTTKKIPRSQQKDRCINSIKNSEESIGLHEGKESNPEMVSERTVNTEVIVTQVKDLVPGDLSQELSDDVDDDADTDDDDVDYNGNDHGDDDSKGEITDVVNTDIRDIIQPDSDGLNFDTCNDGSDSDHLNEGEDKVNELPNRYNSSVHCFEHTEVLSQHSQHSNKTMDNCEEVMSTHSSKTTHSSRTLGDGSNKAGERSAKTLNEVKNIEHAVLTVKNKAGLEKEHRTLSWVKEAQMRHTIERTEKQLVESNEREVDVCKDVINIEV